MRKPDFRTCENKDADQCPHQLHRSAADKCLCFRYIDTVRRYSHAEISCLWWIWSETPKTSFLVTRLISYTKDKSIPTTAFKSIQHLSKLNFKVQHCVKLLKIIIKKIPHRYKIIAKLTNAKIGYDLLIYTDKTKTILKCIIQVGSDVNE